MYLLDIVIERPRSDNSHTDNYCIRLANCCSRRHSLDRYRVQISIDNPNLMALRCSDYCRPMLVNAPKPMNSRPTQDGSMDGNRRNNTIAFRSPLQRNCEKKGRKKEEFRSSRMYEIHSFTHMWEYGNSMDDPCWRCRNRMTQLTEAPVLEVVEPSTLVSDMLATNLYNQSIQQRPSGCFLSSGKKEQ